MKKIGLENIYLFIVLTITIFTCPIELFMKINDKIFIIQCLTILLSTLVSWYLIILFRDFKFKPKAFLVVIVMQFIFLFIKIAIEL